MKNKIYTNEVFQHRFSTTRIKWDHFFESEKPMMEKAEFKPSDKVLDLGCACGGLGLALHEKFGVVDYTGIDINEQSVRMGEILNPSAKLYYGDILDKQFIDFNESFDKVISFCCIDWNIEFDKMLETSWRYVKPGGYLITSLRLTDKETVKDISKSYQTVENDIAQYTIINAQEILNKFKSYNPDKIHAYGYWGEIKSNITTIYDKVCFSVFAVKKSSGNNDNIIIDINLPKNLLL